MAQNEIGGRLRPLESSVHRAASEIESVRRKPRRDFLERTPHLDFWADRNGDGFPRCQPGALQLIDDNLDEARRYEVYGRKVEANIESYRPKDKERLYKYVGGRP